MDPQAVTAAGDGTYRAQKRGKTLSLALDGAWVTGDAVRLDDELQKLDLKDATDISIDGAGLARLDSAGAWLVLRTRREAEKNGSRVTMNAMPESYDLIVKALENAPHARTRRRHHDALAGKGLAQRQVKRLGAAVPGAVIEKHHHRGVAGCAIGHIQIHLLARIGAIGNIFLDAITFARDR